MKTWNCVAIVGVGLIGGSIGLALRHRKLTGRIVGIGRNAINLAKAKKLGAIDAAATDLTKGISAADLVIVCTPVDSIAQFSLEALQHAPAGALVTDAGSTKEEIVRAVEKHVARRKNAPARPSFVGSHPLAGGERSGPEAARADLFEGRTVIVTPTARSERAAVAKTIGFWESLGAKTVTMSPRDHDLAVSATSHVPHLLASVLAASTPEEFLPLVASGWLGITRVASGDAELWRQILTTNRGHVLKTLAKFEKVLQAFRDALDGRNDRQLLELLQAGKTIRDAVGS